MHLVLLTVGLGTFFILGVRALQENLVREVSVDIAADAPDMFLLDIQRDQLAGVIARADRERGRRSAPAPRSLPVLRARVVGVQGRDGDARRRRGRARPRVARPRVHRHLSRRPRSATRRIVAGAAWAGRRPSEAGEVSIEESIRDRFGIDVGDTMRFDVLGRTVAATVTIGAPRRLARQPRRRVHVRLPARRARHARRTATSPSCAGPTRRPIAPGC